MLDREVHVMAWKNDETLREEFDSAMKSKYGDSDGDYEFPGIGYTSVIDVMTDYLHNYEDEFAEWRDEDYPHEHPSMSLWTNDEDDLTTAENAYAAGRTFHPDGTHEALSGDDREYDFSEGDWVVVVATSEDARYIGMRGTVVEIDESDDLLPYRVEFNDGSDSLWASTTDIVSDSEAPVTTETVTADTVTTDKFKVNDPVRVIGEHIHSGLVGVVAALDPDDETLKYHVRIDGFATNRWFRESNLEHNPTGASPTPIITTDDLVPGELVDVDIESKWFGGRNNLKYIETHRDGAHVQLSEETNTLWVAKKDVTRAGQSPTRQEQFNVGDKVTITQVSNSALIGKSAVVTDYIYYQTQPYWVVLDDGERLMVAANQMKHADEAPTYASSSTPISASLQWKPPTQ